MLTPALASLASRCIPAVEAPVVLALGGVGPDCHFTQISGWTNTERYPSSGRTRTVCLPRFPASLGIVSRLSQHGFRRWTFTLGNLRAVFKFSFFWSSRELGRLALTILTRASLFVFYSLQRNIVPYQPRAQWRASERPTFRVWLFDLLCLIRLFDCLSLGGGGGGLFVDLATRPCACYAEDGRRLRCTTGELVYCTVATMGTAI